MLIVCRVDMTLLAVESILELICVRFAYQLMLFAATPGSAPYRPLGARA